MTNAIIIGIHYVFLIVFFESIAGRYLLYKICMCLYLLLLVTILTSLLKKTIVDSKFLIESLDGFMKFWYFCIHFI